MSALNETNKKKPHPKGTKLKFVVPPFFYLERTNPIQNEALHRLTGRYRQLLLKDFTIAAQRW